MSNFICSECGTNYIDCGGAGYKTPKEIELEKKVHILNEANMKLENEFGYFADLSKKIERLQEQLKEANELLKAYGTESLWESLSLSYDEANEYCKKWGVK